MARDNAFGKMMRQLRHDRGLSLSAAAAASGDRITMQGIGRLETGDRQPSPGSLQALAAAYGLVFLVDVDGIRIAPQFDSAPV